MEIVITIHRENLIPISIHAAVLLPIYTYFTIHRTLLMALEAELNWKNLAFYEACTSHIPSPLLSSTTQPKRSDFQYPHSNEN